MARMRSLRPDYFLREDMADVSLEAHFLLAGLAVLADRDGRLLDRPRTIKAQVFPFRDVDVEKVLAELVSAGVVARYSAGGKSVLALLTWDEDQTPHPKETSLGLPPPPVDSTAAVAFHATPQPSRKAEEPSRRNPLGIGCGSRDGSGSGSNSSASADAPPGQQVIPVSEPPKRTKPTTVAAEFAEWARAETRKHLAPDAPDNCRLDAHQWPRLGEALKNHGMEACKAAFQRWMGWQGAQAAGYPLGMFVAKWEGWVLQVKAPVAPARRSGSYARAEDSLAVHERAEAEGRLGVVDVSTLRLPGEAP